MTAVVSSVEERTAGWFPSHWGPDDQAGAPNETDQQTDQFRPVAPGRGGRDGGPHGARVLIRRG
jgi:hypothetical protein